MAEVFLEDEVLINCIQSNPLIYNKQAKNFKNIVRKDIVWAEVAKNCEATTYECQKRWKYLRERYVRELKSQTVLSGGSPAKPSEWEFFDAMAFLKSHVKPKSIHKSNFKVPPAVATMSPLLDDDDSCNSIEYLHEYSEEADGYQRSADETTPIKKIAKPPEIVPSKKRKTVAENEAAINAEIRDVLGTLKNTPSRNAAFGTEVSQYLDSFPTALANKAKLHILQYLSEIDDSL